MKERNKYGTILFLKLESLYERSQLPIICSKIKNHYFNRIDHNRLVECFNIHLNRNYHRTNRKNEYTFNTIFLPEHYEHFDKIFPNDLMQVLGYERCRAQNLENNSFLAS